MGPSFRVLKSIRFSSREAVGELALPEEVAEDGSHAHATLLDGCFQVLASLLGDGGPSYLPFGWDRLWLAGAAAGAGRATRGCGRISAGLEKGRFPRC